MRGRAKLWQVLVSGAVIAVVAVGAAIAVIPDSQGVIHGCYKKANPNKGQVRVIDTGAAQTCASGWTALNWNQKGLAGPTGAPGSTGPAGSSVQHLTWTGDLEVGVGRPTPTIQLGNYTQRAGQISALTWGNITATVQPDCEEAAVTFRLSGWDPQIPGLDPSQIAFGANFIRGTTTTPVTTTMRTGGTDTFQQNMLQLPPTQDTTRALSGTVDPQYTSGCGEGVPPNPNVSLRIKAVDVYVVSWG